MSPADDHGYRNDTGGDAFGGTGQTRTRLPGSHDGDIYGGARRPPRTSRSLITVVGVVVLLIAAIAFANRGGGDDDKGDTAGPSRGRGADATAATGVEPVRGATGGIPTGHPRTEQGAQSAAANYAVALGSDGMYRKESRDRIVGTVYSPEAAAAGRGSLDKVYSDRQFLTGIGLNPDGTVPDGRTFVSRLIPVGTKTDRFDADGATVSVWYLALFGLAGADSKTPVTESWHTDTFRLKWTGNDWKITDVTQKDGPVPVGRDQVASGAEEMADAIQQFGGFTYAR
jgi:hypothetical protein